MKVKKGEYVECTLDEANDLFAGKIKLPDIRGHSCRDLGCKTKSHSEATTMSKKYTVCSEKGIECNTHTKPQHTPTCEACEAGICLGVHTDELQNWEAHQGEDYVHIYGPKHDDSSNPIATVANIKLAQRIVRAVNSHDELLGLLTQEHIAKIDEQYGEKSFKHFEKSDCDVCQAIAKAEGK
jgi:hypothetical protein